MVWGAVSALVFDAHSPEITWNLLRYKDDIAWFALETSSTSVKLPAGSVRWWIFTCWPFLLHAKFLPSFFKHSLNCIFQEIDQIESSSIKARWMDYVFFSLSDRLRNCRGAAVTPSQSVTATAFLAITQQEGSTAALCQTHCQHNSSIHRLFFSLFWTPGHSFLFRFSICMCLCGATSHRQTGWETQTLFRLCLYENSLSGTVSGGQKVCFVHVFDFHLQLSNEGEQHERAFITHAHTHTQAAQNKRKLLYNKIKWLHFVNNSHLGIRPKEQSIQAQKIQKISTSKHLKMNVIPHLSPLHKLSSLYCQLSNKVTKIPKKYSQKEK